jgi:hypothetical protein
MRRESVTCRWPLASKADECRFMGRSCRSRATVWHTIPNLTGVALLSKRVRSQVVEFVRRERAVRARDRSLKLVTREEALGPSVFEARHCFSALSLLVTPRYAIGRVLYCMLVI